MNKFGIATVAVMALTGAVSADFRTDAVGGAIDGTHLLRAWHHARHAALWSPWWQRTRTHALASPLPPPAELHARVVDIMKAGPAYAAAVRAEYEYYAGS